MSELENSCLRSMLNFIYLCLFADTAFSAKIVYLRRLGDSLEDLKNEYVEVLDSEKEK